MRKISKFGALAIAVFMSFGPVEARNEKIYEPALLDEMVIKEVTTTSFTTRTNVSEDNFYEDNYYEGKRSGYRNEAENNYYNASTTHGVSTSTDITYFFVIHHNGREYITTYEKGLFKRYTPVFVEGDPVGIRFNSKGDRLYLLRPDGKEIKTKIFKAARLEKANGIEASFYPETLVDPRDPRVMISTNYY